MDVNEKVRIALVAFQDADAKVKLAERALERARAAQFAATEEAARVLKASGRTKAVLDGRLYSLIDGRLAWETFHGIVLT